MKKINFFIKNRYPDLNGGVICEPFVGGGGALINMAEDFPACKFHINDLNHDIYLMWIFFMTAEDRDYCDLYSRIEKQVVNLDEYRRIFDTPVQSHIDAAFKVIFLNKTSFNGIITRYRPIGGLEQKSKWGVGVYWKPDTLIKKIQRVRNALSGKILSVSNEDFEPFLAKLTYDFAYADPPYLAYGENWYGCNFNLEDLKRLRMSLEKEDNWCISIDNSNEVVSLFHDKTCLPIGIKHTAKSAYKDGKSILEVNELLVFPYLKTGFAPAMEYEEVEF